ncbi:MAG: hypothetical protein ACJAU6_004278 [Alphaproteobacteria bacterium]|jgi:hypothetical protein
MECKMNKTDPINSAKTRKPHSRRTVLGLAAGAGVAALLGVAPSRAQTTTRLLQKGNTMSQKAFVYTELQISVPFAKAPWRDVSATVKLAPGFLSKTWFSGVGNNSIGGLYSFDNIKNAQEFVTGYFPSEAKKFGVAHNTRLFDATLVKDASLDMDSPHFGLAPTQAPGAFVYTEVQVNVPFEKAPWKDRNPVLKQQPGLISKLWLSGLHTNTLGGVDAFDTLENAQAFAINDFPKTAAKMNAAFYTRVFDATASEDASRSTNSPYYA